MARYLYSEIAAAVDAWKRCGQTGNTEWRDKWDSYLDMLESHLSHGSGFDSGTKIDRDRSHAEKLVLTTSYHHMDENGMYCGWTDHTVYVTPSFRGINVRITGRDINGWKEYAYQTFDYALNEDMEYYSLLFMLPEERRVRIQTKWLDQSRYVWTVSGTEYNSFDDAKVAAVTAMKADM